MKTITEYIQKKHIIEVDYVDLGLPSGTLWAKMNIGATEGNRPEDWYGLYFAWGETKGYKEADKHNFTLDNYHFTKDVTQLENKDDAAYQITNGKYRMPTDSELEELTEYTNNEWAENYIGVEGLNGILFTSKSNGKTLFIPASGYYYIDDNLGIGDCLCLWSLTRSSNSKLAAYFFANKDNAGVYGNKRYLGYAVRSVLNK